MGRNLILIAPAALASLFAAAAPAAAGVTNTDLAVSAAVEATCTLSTTAVAFGGVNTLSATADVANGALTVTCTPGTTWTATAGAGNGTGATFAARKMTIPATTNTLNYTLYTNSTRTIIWGDGVSPNGSFTGTGTGAAQANTIYGRVPGSQGTAAVGSYADTVAITVAF